jgi:hypothetical protein
MVDRKQLEAMIAKARKHGGDVRVTKDKQGYISSIQVAGIPRVGPFPMSPISFSEAMHAIGLGVGMNGIEYATQA